MIGNLPESFIQEEIKLKHNFIFIFHRKAKQFVYL